MKPLLLWGGLALAVAMSTPVAARKPSGLYAAGGGSHAVRGHVRRDGRYVPPHRASNPNHTQRDNWSSKPHVNPYNGKPGTKDPRY